MKRLIGLATLAVALGIVAVVYGQKDNHTDTNDEVALFLIDMERQWLQANMTHDPSILEKILADDYQIMRPTGRFSTKSEEIAHVKASNPSCKLQSDHLDDAKVRVFGDVAVLYGWETFVVKCTDKVKTGTYFWSDVWLKRNGRWQAVAGIEPPPTAESPLLPPESKPVAASGASTTGPGGLPLRSYEFEVVTVNSSGTVTNRRKGQARYYVEDISGVALEMVEIPGGTFLMGNTDAGADEVKRAYERRGGYDAQGASKASRRELPQHTVSVPAFYLGKFELTQAQWRAVCELPKVNKDLVCDLSNLPYTFKGDSLPAQQISWEDAIEFCKRLSRATGRTYRLPTEAEWEYAARAGTTTAFYFGDTITPELVNYDGNYPYGSAPKGTSRQTTTPVGSLGYPNAFGLYDMHGNVWEYCMDYWHENYNGAPTDGSSWETGGDTQRRVLRGGSHFHDANHSRSAMRLGIPEATATPSTGFRVVAVAPTLSSGDYAEARRLHR